MVFDLKTTYEIACMQLEKVQIDKIVSESTGLISTTIKNKGLPLHLSKNIYRNIYYCRVPFLPRCWRQEIFQVSSFLSSFYIKREICVQY